MVPDYFEKRESDPEKPDIPGLRRMIDEIDDQMLQLLNRRVALAESIGRLKREQGAPILDPERESLVIDRMTRSNRGPVSADGLRRFYTQIFSICRETQSPL